MLHIKPTHSVIWRSKRSISPTSYSCSNLHLLRSNSAMYLSLSAVCVHHSISHRLLQELLHSVHHGSITAKVQAQKLRPFQIGCAWRTSPELTRKHFHHRWEILQLQESAIIGSKAVAETGFRLKALISMTLISAFASCVFIPANAKKTWYQYVSQILVPFCHSPQSPRAEKCSGHRHCRETSNKAPDHDSFYLSPNHMDSASSCDAEVYAAMSATSNAVLMHHCVCFCVGSNETVRVNLAFDNSAGRSFFHPSSVARVRHSSYGCSRRCGRNFSVLGPLAQRFLAPWQRIQKVSKHGKASCAHWTTNGSMFCPVSVTQNL